MAALFEPLKRRIDTFVEGFFFQKDESDPSEMSETGRMETT
jgi:hypothetical protein